ncbi:MAG: hypothetical protein A2Y10_10605 [Planctomycetes bacterium GWF2_41_51]|nr:MAG: hypothetical protein A2Y10_10605 [Planctomycetes bacterium GWF2_41_51]HBG26926.1 hypothetical protein [Phycisphaerales bacterium]
MRNYKTVRGFTLVELLVVISIIAMLLAVLIPALNKARNIARCVVCQSSIRQLAIAWTTYATSNSGRLVGGYAGVSGTSNNPQITSDMWYSWVEAPSNESGTLVSFDGSSWADAPLADKERGIKKGLLYSYVKTLDVYHCGGDPRLQDNKGKQPARRSYNIGAGMNAPWWYVKNAKMISQIRTPARRYVFVEATDSRGWNQGCWDIDAKDNDRGLVWNNVVAPWHYNRSNWGFADGHAETQIWRDKRTITLANIRDYSEQKGKIGWASKNNPDLLWIFDRREYSPKREGESL